MINVDAFVKSRKTPFSVIPAKAGIQEYQELLDPGFRRGDGLKDFYETVNIDGLAKSQKVTFSVIPAKAGIQFFH